MERPLPLSKATTRSRTPLPCCHHIAPCPPHAASHEATGQALGYFYFEDEPRRRSPNIRPRGLCGGASAPGANEMVDAAPQQQKLPETIYASQLAEANKQATAPKRKKGGPTSIGGAVLRCSPLNYPTNTSVQGHSRPRWPRPRLVHVRFNSG
jgi:hypothetical protein